MCNYEKIHSLPPAYYPEMYFSHDLRDDLYPQPDAPHAADVGRREQGVGVRNALVAQYFA